MNIDTITIIKVVNGYLFQRDGGQMEIYTTLDDILKRLLLAYEGRAEGSSGDHYGKIIIDREYLPYGNE